MDRLLNQAGMKDFLKSEYKLVFFPKRQLKVPRLNYKFLTQKFGESKISKIKHVENSFNEFLKGEPIGDNFGSDHSSRAKWRGQLASQLGKVFLEVYADQNQFAGRNLASVIRNAMILSMSTQNDGNITKHLEEIGQELTAIMQGKNISGKKYNDMESLEEKLEIVHLFEDRIINMLNVLV